MKINGIEYTDDEFMYYYYKVYGENADLDDKEAYIQELNDFAKDHDYSLEGLIVKYGVEEGSITFVEDMIWSESLENMVHSGFTIRDDGIDKHYSWNDEDCVFYNDDTDEDYYMEAPVYADFDELR